MYIFFLGGLFLSYISCPWGTFSDGNSRSCWGWTLGQHVWHPRAWQLQKRTGCPISSRVAKVQGSEKQCNAIYNHHYIIYINLYCYVTGTFLLHLPLLTSTQYDHTYKASWQGAFAAFIRLGGFYEPLWLWAFISSQAWRFQTLTVKHFVIWPPSHAYATLFLCTTDAQREQPCCQPRAV